MKKDPPPLNPPENGRVYWRSLDQLQDTPEFRQWLEREFPEGASEWADPQSRRHFMKIMGASFLLAGFGFAGSGCRRPVETIVPFSKMPENYVHGVPQYFASAMPRPDGAIPLLVKSHDGRPIKIEGNAQHPDSSGGTDRFAQASILDLYDPDRATRFLEKSEVRSVETALDFLASLARKLQQSQGQGVSFLAERSPSPSRLRLQRLIQQKFPQARWYTDEAIDSDVHRRAASTAFGKSVRPRFLLDKADVVLSLDCDFLGSEEDVHNHIRRFSQRRQVEHTELNRLYQVESLMTVTGFSADHRLRLPASGVPVLAAAVAAEILKPGQGQGSGMEKLAAATGVDAQTLNKWVKECAADLAAHRGKSLVLAGHRQPMSVHLLAYALNEKLGNLGQSVVLVEAPETKSEGIVDLANALQQGQVDTLVILGGNPAYTAPSDLNWAQTQRKAKSVVRLAYYEDETSVGCDWLFPAAHYLESWGDAWSSDGTLVPVQPLIAPLFGGITELEFLARLAGEKTVSPYAIVRETFAGVVRDGDFEGTWRKFLHDGFLPNSAARPVDASLNASAVSEAWTSIPSELPSKEKLEVVFHRDYSLDDGRYNNNGWLQELPDPVTKIVWDNVVMVSRKTAGALGLKNNDLVEVKLGDRVVQGPVWVQPGFADYSIGLALGYGRTKTGRVGKGTGFNAYQLRTSQARNFAVGASIRALKKTYPISCTQSHWSLEGRPAVREANLEQYRKTPDFARRMALEDPAHMKSLYPNPFDQVKEKALHQWGMSIDLNRCVGCSACMVACQSENNVPIVGKDQVNRGREMHWLRIDRYYAGRVTGEKNSAEARKNLLQTFQKDEDQQFQTWIDDPQVVTQPMLCQHCEAAPCENVCPVNATTHDQEGLNLMAYNRCVGTRYCSNNCPYKVRRFNFFDYNKRPITELYWGPLGHRKDDEWDLIKMIKNPDVTVRMRGVMEKCTFCVQRIESAKIQQKTRAGASGDVVVPTDSFTTACAQACPAGAIVFGNINDSESHVSKWKQQPRNYAVLEELFTRPRLTYLARVRNPNPAMPDYTPKGPKTLLEYEERMGDPFEKHAEHGAGEEAAHAEKGAH